MYLKFYNLTEKPFNITPDPQFLYLSESHEQTLASMMYGIDKRKGLVAITGDVGVGKTTMVRAYLQKAKTADLEVIYLFYPNVTFRHLVKTICQELELDLAANDPANMVNGLGPALMDLRRRGKNVVVVIDEAQGMPVDTLKDLPIFFNLETAAEKLIQVMLVGQTELDELLEKNELRQLKRGIAVRSHIAPLTPQGSLAYIKHRLSVAGLSGDCIFERKAIDIIIKAADGVPRMLNILCDNALLAGFGYQKNPVTASIAKEIVSDLAWSRKAPDVRKERVGRTLISPKEESGSHIDHRQAASGLTSGQLFQAPILRKLYRLTGRVSQLFDLVCDRALLEARIHEREGVDKEAPRMTAAPSDGRNYVRRETHMSGDFIGDLSEIRLFDLVKPLLDGRKSGMIVIEGADVQELYIEGGSVVHGRNGPSVGEEAVITMMDLDEGRVMFNWRLSPEKRTVSMSTEELMLKWTHQEEEWKKTIEMIGFSDTVFSIVVDNGGKDRLILDKQWGVLALCNGMRSVSEVAAMLDRNEVEVRQTISDMVGMGLLEKAGEVVAAQPKAKATVTGEFFATVETELKKVVGPIARVIMNDTLEDFAESRNAFPKDRVKAFVKTVSEQILEAPKRESFEKALQGVLRGND
ncbi:MAG: AAA family ATPase [Syntrophorhabdales bacterium]|jgi:type II secretory pathway predicted ATPase ExeA